MKLFRSIAGTIAVLFSIQALAAWAAKADHADVKIISLNEASKGRDGSPTCGGG